MLIRINKSKIGTIVQNKSKSRFCAGIHENIINIEQTWATMGKTWGIRLNIHRWGPEYQYIIPNYWKWWGWRIRRRWGWVGRIIRLRIVWRIRTIIRTRRKENWKDFCAEIQIKNEVRWLHIKKITENYAEKE